MEMAKMIAVTMPHLLQRKAEKNIFSYGHMI